MPGAVIAIEQPTKNTGRPIYVVEYHDEKGGRHEARWTLGDLYVSPGLVQKLDVAYLPEAPDQPLGPARVQDVAFQKYCPLVIAAFLAYVMVLMLDQFLSKFFRRRCRSGIRRNSELGFARTNRNSGKFRYEIAN